jgi:hypothetical protein
MSFTAGDGLLLGALGDLLETGHRRGLLDKGVGTALELIEQLPRIGRLDLQLAAFDLEAVVRPVAAQLIGDAAAGVRKRVPRKTCDRDWVIKPTQF